MTVLPFWVNRRYHWACERWAARRRYGRAKAYPIRKRKPMRALLIGHSNHPRFAGEQLLYGGYPDELPLFALLPEA